MPPVPNVILASPRPHAALADERRLLVADERGDRRRARAARVASPTTPAESTIVGSIAGRDAEHLEHALVPRRRRRRVCRPVIAALVASVTCTRAVRQRPRDPRVDRAEAEVAARGRGRRAGRAATASLVADWFGRDAHARRRAASRHAPIVRRSCQPMPGPDRLAGRAVPHDGRTRAGSRCRPRRPGPPASSAARASSRHGVGHRARRRTATSPSAGESGSSSRSMLVRERAVGVARPRRGRCSCRRRRRAPPGRVIAHGQASSPNGLGEAELARVEDAVRVERVLHRLQHAEAGAERVARRSGRG